MNLKVHINANMDPVKRPSKLVPKGIMVHSTATKGVSDERFADRWNVPGLGKSVHAFLDGGSITQILPWNIKAGHCGGAANNTHLSFEMCEPDSAHWVDKATCLKVWSNALELAAYLCKMYGLTEKNVIGHYEGHLLGLASNHADPGHWLPKFGKSMDQFRAELALLLRPAPAKPPAPAAVYHTFARGDTLWSIAKRYGVPLLSIRRRDGTLPNPLAMHVGDVLRVK